MDKMDIVGEKEKLFETHFGVRPKWLCFDEKLVGFSRGRRKHGFIFTVPFSGVFPCSCHGKNSVTVVCDNGLVEAVFFDEVDAVKYCEKYKIKKAEFYTPKLYRKGEKPLK